MKLVDLAGLADLASRRQRTRHSPRNLMRMPCADRARAVLGRESVDADVDEAIGAARELLRTCRSVPMPRPLPMVMSTNSIQAGSTPSKILMNGHHHERPQQRN